MLVLFNICICIHEYTYNCMYTYKYIYIFIYIPPTSPNCIGHLFFGLLQYWLLERRRLFVANFVANSPLASVRWVSTRNGFNEGRDGRGVVKSALSKTTLMPHFPWFTRSVANMLYTEREREGH